MNEKEKWLRNELPAVGLIVGFVVAVVILLIFRPQNETLGIAIFLGPLLGGPLAAYWLARKTDAVKFHNALSLLFCSINVHWYGDGRRRAYEPVGGWECLRCGFRPDGGPPRLPYHFND